MTPHSLLNPSKFPLISHNPYLRIYLAFAPILLLVFIGSLGYAFIEKYNFLESVYMTVITIGTIGFQEVHPLTDSGRIFTILLVLSSMVTLTLVLTSINRNILDGNFQALVKSYKMMRKIDQLENHIIICGCGRNGMAASKHLSVHGSSFVVIEKSISTDFTDQLEYFMEGDATQDEVLLKAGIKKASALICSVPDDADAVFIVLTSRELNPQLTIIARATQETSVPKLKIAGANHVIMPERLGGLQMASLATQPGIPEFLEDLLSKKIEDIRIDSCKSEVTISVGELNVWNKTGATLLALKRDTQTIEVNPGPDSMINPGNEIIIMGNSQQFQALKKIIS